ncbi:hypothetical protein [Sphaerisporangium album]|nr:hypothetical protein [Sphaerisporangium album]
MSYYWSDRDLPVLTAIVQLYGDNPGVVSTEAIQQVSGLDQATVQKALRSLRHSDYFEVTGETLVGSIDGVCRVTEKARRAVRS